MTAIKLPGIHRKVAKGRVYYYHARSGARIKANPDDYAAFVAEVAALDAALPPKQEVQLVSTLGGLIAAYKKSPEWQALAPDTHKSYNRAFDAVRVIDAIPVTKLDQPSVIRIRDNVYAKNGRWLGNQVVAVLSIVLGWGVPRGHVRLNAAQGVPKIRRNRSLGVANKAWLADEVYAALGAAPSPGIRKGIALAYYTGMRKKDVVAVPAAARASGEINIHSSKPGEALSVFEAKRLSAILDEPDSCEGLTLVRNLDGRPYSRDGFDTMFDKLKRKLVKEGKIRPGLTFHGLRKSLGRDAAALGFSENDIAGALGQKNPASARPYTIEHQQRDAAKRVIEALEQKGKR